MMSKHWVYQRKLGMTLVFIIQRLYKRIRKKFHRQNYLYVKTQKFIQWEKAWCLRKFSRLSKKESHPWKPNKS